MASTETNVQVVQTQSSALRFMEGRKKAPKSLDPTELPGGSKLGKFWNNSKSEKRCGRPTYELLLTNPVLRADYRYTHNY